MRIKELIMHSAVDDTKRWLAVRDKILKRKYRTFLGKNLLKRTYNKIMWQNGSSIDYGASLGDGISFPHGICGVFISEGAIIGKNCVIMQQVTVGSNTLPDTKCAGAPEIGENVFLGAGAKIIGGVKIGSNVRVGANCVVYKDVPDNCTVVQASGMRIIEHPEARDNSFVPFNKWKK